MNKGLIIEMVIKNLQQEAADIQRAIDYAYQEARSSPMATESHSDGRRREQQQMAVAHEQTKQKIENAIKSLQKINPTEKYEKPQIGSLIKANLAGKEQWYFIVPYGSGKKLKIENETVITLSPESPLGEKLLKEVSTVTELL